MEEHKMILNDPCGHSFGGSWTEEKLSILTQYMDAYMEALKNQSFSFVYIDAFAGTGERIEETSELSESDPFLFSPDGTKLKKRIFDGSAKISLELKRTFDEYWFIEKNQNRFDDLCSLKGKHPNLSSKINCEQGDANVILPRILKKYNWQKERGILFLDPYGASVTYETLKEISKCKGMDIWLLFPVGQEITRLLTNNPENMPTTWEEKLNRVFGCKDWRVEFYTKEKKETLFDTYEVEIKNTDCEKITDFYKQQLKKVFINVANETIYFSNSKNVPLFALIFAMTNPSPAAQNLAIKIANYLLKPKGY
jgi:three-Cys-motif partner protein